MASDYFSPFQKLVSKESPPFACVTCYDHQMARWLNDSEVDVLLVGDSVAEVIYGKDSTRRASMELMLDHTKAVSSGAPNKHVMGDMPFGSYDEPDKALENAKRLVDMGAQSVKLENPLTSVVEKLVANDIAVCGHVGLQPQTHELRKKRGKEKAEADEILSDALRLESIGCFCILMEAVQQELAALITQKLKVPTIGIASGPHCDGKIIVLYDLLGLTYSPPPFAKKLRVADFGEEIKKSIAKFRQKNTN